MSKIYLLAPQVGITLYAAIAENNNNPDHTEFSPRYIFIMNFRTDCQR
jgi:hypothetical protein